MKFKKKFFSLVILIGIFLCVAYASNGDAVPDVVVCLQIDTPIMQVNGESEEIDEGRGTSPVIKDGRTLVPIRAIIEAFGGVVKWNESEKTVILSMDDDIISLSIDSDIAYLNGSPSSLEVAPAVINERIMMPVRFVAESFNLGVAWDEKAKKVYIIRNYFDKRDYRFFKDEIPEYTGEPYAILNNNVPYFKEYEIISCSFEYYNELDDLGRCNVCMASVAEDLMPTEKRGNISTVKPTGWENKKYSVVSGGYLYNRCHLIGYQLTGENANERNLITGTRYLNIEGMLPFENMIDKYVDETGNHVMYRSTPVFSRKNLLADGVILEALSVEDEGEGISFCVFCYNVQPHITIDYATGDNYYGEN